MKQFKTSNRKTIFSELHDYCYLSKEHDYIEVTEWTNGDGFDIHVSGHIDQKISLTHGEFKLLKKLIKELKKDSEEYSWVKDAPNLLNKNPYPNITTSSGTYPIDYNLPYGLHTITCSNNLTNDDK